LERSQQLTKELELQKTSIAATQSRENDAEKDSTILRLQSRIQQLTEDKDIL
jgi:hypothetical protein